MATPRGDETESPAGQGLDAATTSLRPAPVVRQRALVTLTPSPRSADVARTPPVDEPESPATGRLGRATRDLRARSRRPGVRRSLIGVAALAQTFILVSAIAWWTDQGSMEASAAVAPVAWTGVVHDVGAAGVNLRTAPQAVPGTSRDTAARGSRLALTCARTGDLVTDESGAHSDMWLRTSDGLYVSLLYVDVPDRSSIVSCADASGDAPVLALDEPAGGTGRLDGPPPPESAVLPAAAAPAEPADRGRVVPPEPAADSGAASGDGAQTGPTTLARRDTGPDHEPEPAGGGADPVVPGVEPLPAGARPGLDGGAGSVEVADGVRVPVETRTHGPLSTTTPTRTRSTSPTTTTTRHRDAVAVG